jgi:hypothetical protein
MTKLYPIESQIIQSLLVREFGPSTPLLDQLASSEFDVIHMTGTGFYVDLSVPESAPRLDKINAESSGAYKTSLAPPCDLVGFTLFIRDGCLSSFEGYTFGDVRWPDEPIKNWVVLERA